MNILMSPRKKLSLLVILLFAILVAATTTIIMTTHVQGWGISSWKEIFFPDAILSIAVIFIIMCLSYLHVNRKIGALVDETLDSLASGIIYFDGAGNLARFNPAAAIMVPEISETEISENYIGTYKRFLAFIYDRSLDIHDQSRLSLDITQMNLSRLLFREVVEFSGHRIVLVQFYQRTTSDIIAVLTDISMMKRHIDEVASLTEENRIMIKAIEAGGSGMMIAQNIDATTPVIFSNETFAKTLGQSVETLSGCSFPNILEQCFEDQINVIRNAVSLARREGSAENIWLKMRPDKKTVLWYAMYILFFRDNNDKEFYVCFLSDRTQAKLSQAKIYQSQKLEAVAQLAGGIAHDFNNIFSIIDGYSKLIQRGLEKGNDVSEFFQTIDRSIQRATQTTGRLLTFGQCRITQKIRLDICDHILDMEAFLAPVMDDNINMIITVQDEPCYIDASPDAITQIVISLANNAREAMKRGGDLIISVAEASKSQILSSQKVISRDMSYACIQMIDSGSGMDHDILGRVYEPFFTTRDPATHSGLGMSLVYGLVKELDGIIDIKSTPDLGTSVSIFIPLQKAPVHPLFTKPINDGNSQVLNGKTILVVEDSADLLEMECQLLTEAKLNVLRASSAEEAIQIQKSCRTPIDLLLVDVTLPGMNGIELSDYLAELNPKIKIILISAYPGLVRDKQDSIILAKPFAYEKLEALLIDCFEKETGPEQLSENRHWLQNKARYEDLTNG